VPVKAVRKRSHRVRTGPVSYEQAANRRIHVLQIAGNEFLTHGFHGTSIDVIARRSRVSKVTIYRECGSKDMLFREFLIAAISAFRYNLEQAIHSDRPLGDVVRDIIRIVLAANSDKRNLGLLRLAIAERNRFPHVARLVLDQAFDIARPLGEYLRTKSGARMSTAEAERRAFHLMNMALGGSGALLDDPKSFYSDQRTWIESVAQTFLDGFPPKT